MRIYLLWSKERFQWRPYLTFFITSVTSTILSSTITATATHTVLQYTVNILLTRWVTQLLLTTYLHSSSLASSPAASSHYVPIDCTHYHHRHQHCYQFFFQVQLYVLHNTIICNIWRWWLYNILLCMRPYLVFADYIIVVCVTVSPILSSSILVSLPSRASHIPYLTTFSLFTFS